VSVTSPEPLSIDGSNPLVTAHSFQVEPPSRIDRRIPVVDAHSFRATERSAQIFPDPARPPSRVRGPAATTQGS
jgi:hypothetical protein